MPLPSLLPLSLFVLLLCASLVVVFLSLQDPSKRHLRLPAAFTYSGLKNGTRVLTSRTKGRLGNLLMETATLILAGEKANMSVMLLPEEAASLSHLLSPLPVPFMDISVFKCVHLVEHERCPCPFCKVWTVVQAYTFYKDPTRYMKHDYILLEGYNSPIVLANAPRFRQLFLETLRPEPVARAQSYLRKLEVGHQPQFVAVHVRRTDYVAFLETRFNGSAVDVSYFLHSMKQLSRNLTNPVFLVVSDDLDWCRRELGVQYRMQHPLLFPDLGSGRHDAVVTDLVLLSQANHSVYDYGSFGFWGAELAGGRTMVAEGYSSKPHMILRALRRQAPPNWTLVDVRKIASNPVQVVVENREDSATLDPSKEVRQFK